MGDRALYQVVAGKHFSPVIYTHWSGADAPRICKRIKEQMKSRPRDLEYTAARLLQCVIPNANNSSTGFGLWNATAILTREDTHYDAGIILVDVSKDEMTFSCFGGYLVIDPETGFPTERAAPDTSSKDPAHA